MGGRERRSGPSLSALGAGHGLSEEGTPQVAPSLGEEAVNLVGGAALLAGDLRDGEVVNLAGEPDAPAARGGAGLEAGEHSAEAGRGVRAGEVGRVGVRGRRRGEVGRGGGRLRGTGGLLAGVGRALEEELGDPAAAGGAGEEAGRGLEGVPAGLHVGKDGEDYGGDVVLGDAQAEEDGGRPQLHGGKPGGVSWAGPERGRAPGGSSRGAGIRGGILAFERGWITHVHRRQPRCCGVGAQGRVAGGAVTRPVLFCGTLGGRLAGREVASLSVWRPQTAGGARRSGSPITAIRTWQFGDVKGQMLGDDQVCAQAEMRLAAGPGDPQPLRGAGRVGLQA